MRDAKVIVLLLISLFVGVGIGSGLGYFVYGPQIESLNNQMGELNTKLDKLDTAISSMDKPVEDDSIKELSQSIDEIKSSVAEIEAETKELKVRIVEIDTQISAEDPLIDVYNRVSPSVVFITSNVLTFDFFTMREVPSEGVGSGVIVSPEGYILTNNHVVEDAEFITVSYIPGQEVEAELIGTDPPTDLAVLKIDLPADYPVATLGDSDRVKVGMTAVAIGNPFSLERTVTVGVVSSVNRTIEAETGDIIFGMIQTDASVNPGNSGGPLVNLNGEVIGINSAIISPVGAFVGIGFAIPINTAKKVMTQLIEKGRVSRPYLGITGVSVDELPEELNPSDSGVLLVEVLSGSPADKAGLQGFSSEVRIGGFIYPIGGDVITSFGGEQVNTIEDLLEVLSKKEVGESVSLEYLRGTEKRVASVLLEERPE